MIYFIITREGIVYFKSKEKDGVIFGMCMFGMHKNKEKGKKIEMGHFNVILVKYKIAIVFQ